MPTLEFPDNLIVQTEQLTSNIHHLLADAQHGNTMAFPVIAERVSVRAHRVHARVQMSRVVDTMCSLVPAHVSTPALRECLSAMGEASVTLTVRCAAAAREHQASGDACAHVHVRRQTVRWPNRAHARRCRRRMHWRSRPNCYSVSYKKRVS
jgi:hypothetical protein